MKLFKLKSNNNQLLFKDNQQQFTLTNPIKKRNYIINNNNSNNSDSINNSNLIKSFKIEFDNNKIYYNNGDYLIGEVILLLNNKIKNILLNINLICKLNISHGNINKILINNKALLYGGDTNNGLSKGEHRFPFKIKIPNNSISSINFERGSIIYKLNCSLEEINNNSTILSNCSKNFNVLSSIDVKPFNDIRNKTVVLQSSTSINKSVSSHDDGNSSYITKITNNSTSSSNNSHNSSSKIRHNNNNNIDKRVIISVNLPHSGFTIGEIIPITISLKHYKEFSHPTSLIATLVRICRVCGNDNNDQITETFRKDICQSISPVYIDPITLECNILMYLKIPLDVFPTFNKIKNFFSFQYYVEVMVNLSQKNIIYTESNRIIGKPNDKSPQSGEILMQRLEDNVNHIQRSLLSKINNNTNDNQNDNNNISYNDMVNVDKLKRLRNVTGMSIEIVIGTYRSIEKPQEPPPQQQQENSITNTNQLSNWLNDINLQQEQSHNMLLPEYSPPINNNNNNTMIVNTNDDKNELERERLKQLESDPPTMDY